MMLLVNFFIVAVKLANVLCVVYYTMNNTLNNNNILNVIESQLGHNYTTVFCSNYGTLDVTSFFTQYEKETYIH